jgi:metacaspase-1
MKSLLQDCFGFQEANMIIMVDDTSYGIGKTPSPTGANIKKQLGALAAASQPGDVLVFHFSGHGTQVRSYVEESRHDHVLESSFLETCC